MTDLEQLQKYLEKYQYADAVFSYRMSEGIIFLEYAPAAYQHLPIYDINTILLVFLRRKARIYLGSACDQDKEGSRDEIARRYLDAINSVEDAHRDKIVACVSELKLPFVGEDEDMLAFISRSNLVERLTTKANFRYFLILREEYGWASDSYLKTDKLQAILSLQDASFARELLYSTFGNSKYEYVQAFLSRARGVFEPSQAPNKQALIAEIKKYRDTALSIMFFLLESLSHIGRIYKQPKICFSSIYFLKKFDAGMFFETGSIEALPVSLQEIFIAYLDSYKQQDIKISPLNLAEALQMPDAIVIEEQKRLIEILSFQECFLVYARHLARKYFKQSLKDGFAEGYILSAFFLLFSYLKGNGDPLSAVISALQHLPKEEPELLCKALLSSLQHALDAHADIDARLRQVQAQGVLYTMRLESGEARIPDLITVVKLSIRCFMREYIRNSEKDIRNLEKDIRNSEKDIRNSEEDIRNSILTQLARLAVYTDLMADLEKRSLSSLENNPLLAQLPRDECGLLSQYAAAETIANFQACHQTTLSGGDFFVFSEQLTALRLALGKIERFITALTGNGLSLISRRLMISNIPDLNPEDKSEALKCLDDEFNSGEINPVIEAGLRGLLQRVLIQRERLLSEIGIIKNIIDNIQKQCADRDLRSTLGCFAAFDEYVLSTTALANLDLSQPVNLAPSHGVNFPPIIAFRTFLLVAMRQKIREHIEKNPAEHEACDALLSKVTAASLDQLLDVINGLTSDIAEGKHLIKYIKQLFNEDVVFKCYVQHQALIDACDVHGLYECMEMIRQQLAQGDFRNEPLLTALEMMAADVQASQRLCQRVYDEVIARDAEMFEDWLLAEEARLDEVLKADTQVYVAGCMPFVEPVKEEPGVLLVKGLKVWDLQTWAARVYQQSDSSDLSLAIQLDGLRLLSVPGFLSETAKSFTNQEMFEACQEYRSCNSKEALKSIGDLIEETREHYQFIAGLRYREFKQYPVTLRDQEKFREIFGGGYSQESSEIYYQQLYQLLKSLRRLNNNMLLTGRLSDYLEERVDPIRFEAKRKQQDKALENLIASYQERLEASIKRHLRRTPLAAVEQLRHYLYRYEVFDARYRNAKIYLDAGTDSTVIPDSYTRVMIEIRQALRSQIDLGKLSEDVMLAFLRFLDSQEPMNLDPKLTLSDCRELALKLLEANSEHFDADFAKTLGLECSVLPKESAEDFDCRVVPAIEQAALRCHQTLPDLRKAQWISIDLSRDFPGAGVMLVKDLEQLKDDIKTLDEAKQRYISSMCSSGEDQALLVEIKDSLAKILSRMLEAHALYSEQVFADQESLCRLLTNIKAFQPEQRKSEPADSQSDTGGLRELPERLNDGATASLVPQPSRREWILSAFAAEFNDLLLGFSGQYLIASTSLQEHPRVSTVDHREIFVLQPVSYATTQGDTVNPVQDDSEERDLGVIDVADSPVLDTEKTRSTPTFFQPKDSSDDDLGDYLDFVRSEQPGIAKAHDPSKLKRTFGR